VAEDLPTNDNGAQEETPARQDVDVLLDVSELEVDRINLTVSNLRAHVSVLAELASLLSLQVSVDARLADTRNTLQEVLDELGDQAQGERSASGGVAEVPSSSSAADEPSGRSPNHD
jgi:hypothetical protein